MRLALVAANIRQNGPPVLPNLLASHWTERGWPVTFISLEEEAPEPNAAEEALPPGVERQTLAKTTAALGPGAMLKLRRTIKETQPQAVISFGDISNMLCLGALAGSDIPVIAAECANPLCSPVEQLYGGVKRRALCRLRNWLYRLAHNVVLETEDALDYSPPRRPAQISGDSRAGTAVRDKRA